VPDEEVMHVVNCAHALQTPSNAAAVSIRNNTSHGLMAGLGRFLLKFMRFAFVIYNTLIILN
jgi:hypothetical protein